MSTTATYFSGAVTMIHGDCVAAMREMAPASIDMIFCDPPYGNNNNDDGDLIHRREAALGKGDHGDARAIANDGAEALPVFKAMLAEAHRVLRPGSCCCCCCCGGGPRPTFAHYSLAMDEAIGFKMAVCWDKGPMGMGWHYRRSYEFVLVAEKPGAACKWHDESSRVENIIRPGDYGIKKIIPSAAQHPTEKPVQLAAHFIRLHSLPGEAVLDPFMGSGTTGLAAVRQGRRFIGCELDRQWFDEACRRMEEEERQGVLFGAPKVEATNGDLFASVSP